MVRRVPTYFPLILLATACGTDGAVTAQQTNETAELEVPAPPPEGDDFLPEGNGWTLVWTDEFEGDELDYSKWRPEESCWGGGNNERQCYTARTENVQVVNGQLRLIARPEEWTGPNFPPEFGDEMRPKRRTQPYTSGKIRSLGLADWTYGRFSARLKLPEGQGTWPAFWMMPAENAYGTWPLSGEIDIMEAANLKAYCEDCTGGTIENHTQGALHFGDSPPGNTYLVEETPMPDGTNPADGFHVYTVEWGEGRIQWFVDDKLFMRADAADWFTAAPDAEGNENAPFDRPFYLMLNLAVGGTLSENFNEGGLKSESFPAEVQADWIRVYQCSSDPTTGRACMDEGEME